MVAPILQAEAVFAAKARNAIRSPKPVRVAFRAENGSVGHRDSLTHWIHSYPAKMFHRIPQVILDQLSPSKKLCILDPFCGSGTVLLETIARGHRAIGIDVNPMAQLISRVKVTPVQPERLKRHSKRILRQGQNDTRRSVDHEILDFWFKRESREALESLHRAITSIKEQSYRDFFLVCFSSIVRRSSLADPTIPPPVKLNPKRARVANSRYRNDLKRAQSLTSNDVFCLFHKVAASNIARMETLVNNTSLGKATILSGGCEAAQTGLRSASVDLVITSPPYCGAQKYVRSMRLEMLLLGHTSDVIAEIDRKTLGTERVSSRVSADPSFASAHAERLFKRIEDKSITRANIFASYAVYLDRFTKELSRVLKPGCEGFVTFGTDCVAGVRVDCSELFAQSAMKYGLRHIATLVDSIPSRGMITDRHSSAAIIKDERVVWVRKNG